jgi:hypothetical protein
MERGEARPSVAVILMAPLMMERLAMTSSPSRYMLKTQSPGLHTIQEPSNENGILFQMYQAYPSTKQFGTYSNCSHSKVYIRKVGHHIYTPGFLNISEIHNPIGLYSLLMG